MENKRKHLEFIQNVIKRMSGNSFLLRGWSITIITGVVALSGSIDNFSYLFIALFLIFVFWFLDAFYLSQERQYRDLYKSVTIKKEPQIDFSMDAREFNKGKNTWFSSIFSRIFLIFYGFAVLILILILSHFFEIKIIINSIN